MRSMRIFFWVEYINLLTQKSQIDLKLVFPGAALIGGLMTDDEWAYFKQFLIRRGGE